MVKGVWLRGYGKVVIAEAPLVLSTHMDTTFKSIKRFCKEPTHLALHPAQLNVNTM